MVFGKRPGSARPPQVSASPSPALDQPEFPRSRQISPCLVSFGSGESHPADGSERLVRFLIDAYSDERGVQAETILSAAGALAGFAAQESIWEGFVRPGKLTRVQAFVCVQTKSGQTYYFGDLLNKIVASTTRGELSIWRMVAGAAVQLGAQSLPDLKPIFVQCSETVGTPAFGRPPQAEKWSLKELPRDALRHWPPVKSILLTAGVQPPHWGLEVALAAQKLILQIKDVVPPDIAAFIVMQSAIPMSKIDPRTVPGGSIVD